jgi:hypothetical protein
MSNRRIAALVLALIVSLVACDDHAASPAPDATPVPIDLRGRFEVQGSLALAAPPSLVATVLSDLAAATDGPDDPSRFLLELIVDRLPPGRIKTLAVELTPFVAAYVNGRIAIVAPQLAGGVRKLVDGLGRIARRFGTIEDVEIHGSGHLRRTIEGIRFDTVAILFDEVGLAATTVDAVVTREGDRLTIAGHRAGIAYGPLLRLGLDRAVIPAVVPGATDLAQALTALVDCPRLGELIAEAIGLGAPALYAQACAVGLTTAATRIYDRLPAPDAPPVVLEVTGTARIVDRDGNGATDAIEDGVWMGTFDAARLGAATFHGTSR